MPEHPSAPAPRRAPTRSGPGIVLISVYAIFALAAGARSTYQVLTRFEDAPLAYSLSALAAAVYIVATFGLASGGRGARRLALLACSIELAGVVVIGTLSVLFPAAFPDQTVWSGYGSGYGFVPLVLPVLGLLWLRRTARPA
jgi:hypothetical protein